MAIPFIWLSFKLYLGKLPVPVATVLVLPVVSELLPNRSTCLPLNIDAIIFWAILLILPNAPNWSTVEADPPVEVSLVPL